MTPKEKAAELIEKFKINDYDWIAQGNLYCVIQHALICVDEIIKALPEDYQNDIWSYWQEVKYELNIL